MRNSFGRGAVAPLVVVLILGTLTACGRGSSYNGGGGNGTPPAPTPSAYAMTKLVSDGSVAAQTIDARLKNPWGIVFAPGAPVWIANAATQTSTLYDGTGVRVPLVVTIPAGLNGDSNPTGIVANTSTVATDFTVTNTITNVSAAARFIFATESGTISGWAPTADATHAIIGYDDGAGGAIYKGLAIAANGTATFLYATDFHNNKVDVFDSTYHKVVTTGGFVDPTLPDGYAPFGIQTLKVQDQTLIYVTYGKQDDDAEDEENGDGLGMIDVYDVNGTLQKHLVPVGGPLDAPWGLALAPATFGTLGNMLLVGNFGSGTIAGFDPVSGQFAGFLRDANSQVIATPGLWGIAFGNGARNQPTGTLYFAAGIADEVDGLYGRIDLQ